jgi:hypothetical protein
VADVGESFEDTVEKLAIKLLREGDVDDMEAARRAARRRIEDSEERTFDPATTDPEDQGVIRRTSSQTATDGSSGAGGTIRSSHEGE